MRSHPFPPLLPLLALLFSAALGGGGASAARAQQIVVPNSLTAAEGNSNNASPFLILGARRYQQVYNASEFSLPDAPALITQIVFRPNAGAAGYVFSLTVPDAQIRLSTTAASADSLSGTFDDNLGADTAFVFSGPLIVSTRRTGPEAGPRDFDIVIDLKKPFLYDPSAGNLLLDVICSPTTEWAAGTPFDAVDTAGDATSRLVGSAASATGTPDTLGLVTRFTVVPDNTLADPLPGTVATWGNFYGGSSQSPAGTLTFSKTPIPVTGMTGAVAVAAGDKHSLALRSDGTVAVWGDNTLGQIGDGTQFRRDNPVPVSGVSDVVAIAAGYNHSLALRRDGTIAAWGYNGSGQVGNGTTSPNIRTPITVTGLTDVVAIAAGAVQSLAVRKDGTVYFWGGSSDPSTVPFRPTPVKVNGVSGVIAVATGYQHYLALRSDGTVAAWGGNFSGQVGDGTTVYRSAPITIPGLTGIVAITATWHQSFALRADGTVFAWGNNQYGQLGDGTFQNSRLTPVIAGRLTDVTAIAGGINYTVALRRDGTLVSCGHNNFGQLGDGTQTIRTTPTPVIGLSNIVGISAGNFHCLALTGADWYAQSLAVGADNNSRLLWKHRDGRAALRTVRPDGDTENTAEFGPYDGWSGRRIAVGMADSRTRLLWNNSDGRVSLWTITSDGTPEITVEYGPYPRWSGNEISVGSDSRTRLLWNNTDGRISLWTLHPSGGLESSFEYGPYAGWIGRKIAVGSDNKTRLLWNHSDGRVSLWTIGTNGGFESGYEFGPYPQWTGSEISMGSDNKARLVWKHTDGRVSLWRITGSGHVESTYETFPTPGGSFSALSVGPTDHRPRLLWNHWDGKAGLWTLPINGGLDTLFEFGPY